MREEEITRQKLLTSYHWLHLTPKIQMLFMTGAKEKFARLLLWGSNTFKYLDSYYCCLCYFAALWDILLRWYAQYWFVLMTVNISKQTVNIMFWHLVYTQPVRDRPSWAVFNVGQDATRLVSDKIDLKKFTRARLSNYRAWLRKMLLCKTAFRLFL